MNINATRTMLVSISMIISSLACAALPAPLRDATNASQQNWVTVQPAIRNAIECRSPLQHSSAVRIIFGATNDNLDGDHQFPEPITIFGSLKISSVSVFEGGDEAGTSYTVHFENVKMAEVVKAAGLKKDLQGLRFIRTIKGGLLEASTPQPGVVQLACIRGGSNE